MVSNSIMLSIKSIETILGMSMLSLSSILHKSMGLSFLGKNFRLFVEKLEVRVSRYSPTRN